MLAGGQTCSLVVTNDGLGNGIIILPFLAILERVDRKHQFWHTQNEILKCEEFLKQAEVSGNVGDVPALWRRFNPKDHCAMIEFMREHMVGRLINLRLTCREDDANYFQFRDLARERDVDCWDLYECGDSIYNAPIGISLERLLLRKGLPPGSHDRRWLGTFGNSGHGRYQQPTLALCLSASQKKKRWSPHLWSQLATRAIRAADARVLIFAGRSREEKTYARQAFDGLCMSVPSAKAKLIEDLSLEDFARALRQASYAVTHDSFVSHLCAAMAIPSITLFLCTNSRIWRPYGLGGSRIIQSQEALDCERMKRDGTCERYYKTCEATCAAGIMPDQVHEVLLPLLLQYAEGRPVSEGEQ